MAAGWPRPLAAIGDGDRGRALTIESLLTLTAFEPALCDLDHIGVLSEQQNHQGDHREATDEHSPIP